MTKLPLHGMPDRRTVVAGLVAAAAPTGVLRAQSAWPQGRTIKVVVPFAAAGATDILGRLMADRLGAKWGATFVVENRAGAGGNIGTDVVAKSAPDGNTMLVVSVGMATNPYLFEKLTYDPVRDFEPATLIAMVPNILVVTKGAPYNSVSELIAYAKANPGKVTFASAGTGTSIHLSGELFQQLTGTKMVHVPYKGAGQAKIDLVGGQVDIMFDNITSSLPLARSGQVKAFGITTAKKSIHAPELEPIATTVPGFDVSSWFAIFMPAGTPRPMLDRIAVDVRAALDEPAVKEKMVALAADPVGSSPDDLKKLLAAESQKWGTLIKGLGIRAE